MHTNEGEMTILECHIGEELCTEAHHMNEWNFWFSLSRFGHNLDHPHNYQGVDGQTR